MTTDQNPPADRVRAIDLLQRARDIHRETCILARGDVQPSAFRCGMCEVLDTPAAPAAVPPVDRAALRDRIAEAARTVRLRLGPNAIAMAQRGEPIILNLNEADDLATELLAVLPPPVSRAEPDDTDLSEADIDRMMAAAVPVQIVTEPPDTHAVLVPPPVSRADVLREAADEAPAATCSAQYHGVGEDRARLCIRAAQHQRTAHTDEHGFHWSDTVAMYPLADGTFRTGVNLRAALRRMADEAQPECSASRTGHCLRESQSETACDTEAGECVHGGRPADEAQPAEAPAESTEPRPCRTFVSGGPVWCCEEGETDCPCTCHQRAAGAATGTDRMPETLASQHITTLMNTRSTT